MGPQSCGHEQGRDRRRAYTRLYSTEHNLLQKIIGMQAGETFFLVGISTSGGVRGVSRTAPLLANPRQGGLSAERGCGFQSSGPRPAAVTAPVPTVGQKSGEGGQNSRHVSARLPKSNSTEIESKILMMMQWSSGPLCCPAPVGRIQTRQRVA